LLSSAVSREAGVHVTTIMHLTIMTIKS
jgi:hypothetical protein